MQVDPQKTTPNTTTKDSTKSQIKYLEIKEWGVKFEISDTLTGLYYYLGNDGNSAYFSLDTLKGTECAADKIAQATLNRATEAEMREDPLGTGNAQTAQKVDNHYYYAAGGQARCSDDETIQAKATQMSQNVVEAIKAGVKQI